MERDMIYYSFHLPFNDYCYMTEKAVKAVMDEVSPIDAVDFSKLADEEVDEYISAWQSGTAAEFIEEMMITVIGSDKFIKDTVSLLWTDSAEYAEEVKRHVRQWFLSDIAEQLEQNIAAVLVHEGYIAEDAA